MPFIAALLLLLLTACASLPEAPADAPVFYVVRHMNTPEGERDPDLTAEGRENAERLARWLEGRRAPEAIHVTDFRRTRQTAAPAAARLGLEPSLYDPADSPGIAARVRAEGLSALIVGHSNTVPDIVEALGGERPAPLAHPDFGDIWIIAEGRTRRERLSDENHTSY